MAWRKGRPHRLKRVPEDLRQSCQQRRCLELTWCLAITELAWARLWSRDVGPADDPDDPGAGTAPGTPAAEVAVGGAEGFR